MSYITMRLRQNDTQAGFRINSDTNLLIHGDAEYNIFLEGNELKETPPTVPKTIANLQSIKFENADFTGNTTGQSLKVTIKDNSGNDLVSTISLRSD